MSRLIDASDVKKRGDCYLPYVRDAVSNILRHVKTVKDAVVVVRCKDCKFAIRCPTKNFGGYSDDWFCADGERK